MVRVRHYLRDIRIRLRLIVVFLVVCYVCIFARLKFSQGMKTNYQDLSPDEQPCFQGITVRLIGEQHIFFNMTHKLNIHFQKIFIKLCVSLVVATTLKTRPSVNGVHQ